MWLWIVLVVLAVMATALADERPEKFAGNGKKPVRRGGS